MIPGADSRKALEKQEVTPNADSCLVPGLVSSDPDAPAMPADPDLAHVIETWSRLPQAVRQAVISLLATALPHSKNSDSEEPR
jgi:hypothetical protein